MSIVSAAALVAGAAIAGPPGVTDVLFESFEDGLRGWSAHGSVGCEPRCTLDYAVQPSDEVALDGVLSLDFTADGEHDDGTVWVQRPLQLPAGVWRVQLQFHMFDEFESDVNQWEVIAYLGLAAPQAEGDFTQVGSAGEQGWTAYGHEAVLDVAAPTTAYLAFGYNIVWETPRTHWFDAVTIAGVPAQPDPGDANGDGVVDVDDLIAVIGAWGPCAAAPTFCPADMDGDATVGVDDLLLVLLGWS